MSVPRAHPLRYGLACFAVALAAPTGAGADNAWEWPDQGLEASPGNGASAWAFDMVVWDDGTGPALYTCGVFNLAGGKPASGLARWSNGGWSDVGASTLGGGIRLMGYNDGSGPALFVDGLSKWDGKSWTHGLPGLFSSATMGVFDDGLGPVLYAGGGTPNFVKWDGAKWNTIIGSPVESIEAMAVFDDGTGSKLFVGGGNFQKQPLGPHVASWDGQKWFDSPGGISTGPNPGSPVAAMVAFDDGSGLRLFVSGNFNETQHGAPGNGIVTWNGKTWGKADGGLPVGMYARDFTVVGEGKSANLYAVGGKTAWRWTGNAWEAFPQEPINSISFTTCGAGFDDGSGMRLYVGGSIYLGGGHWPNIVRSKFTVGGGTPGCGDLNGDGYVSQQDLGILLADYGCTKGVGLCPGDCDDDGDTDQSDLGILLSNYEKACP